MVILEIFTTKTITAIANTVTTRANPPKAARRYNYIDESDDVDEVAVFVVVLLFNCATVVVVVGLGVGGSVGA